jgi:oligopeptide/dipeptide ABC transporter ATP-binding protein
MYLGKAMKIADRDALYAEPQHPYTKALLDAVPIPDPALEAKREYRVLGGEVPSPLNPPRGCVFHTRCPLATEECKMVVPELREGSAQALCLPASTSKKHELSSNSGRSSLGTHKKGGDS